MKKKFTLICLFALQPVLAMHVQRIKPNPSLIERLETFHATTYTGDDQKKPNMDKFQAPGRIFVGKIDTFGLDRYFLFKTNQNVQELVEGVRRGGGGSVAWLKYDLEPEYILHESEDNLNLIAREPNREEKIK